MAFTTDQNLEQPSDGASNSGQAINDNSDKHELRTKKFTCGTKFAQGEYGYINWSDKKVYKAKADADGTKRTIGPALEAYVTDEEGFFVLEGRQTKTGWSFTSNGEIYLSDATAGAVTQTAPTKKVLLGYPTATTEMICINPVVLS